MCKVSDLQAPQGIGGWLLLPAGYVILGPIATFLVIRLGFTGNSRATWPELVLSLAELLLSVFVAFAFFQQRPYVPRLMVAYLITGIIIPLLGALLPGNRPDDVQLSYALAVMIGVVFAVVWIPYFLLSRRVANTFVSHPTPESRLGAQWLVRFAAFSAFAAVVCMPFWGAFVGIGRDERETYTFTLVIIFVYLAMLAREVAPDADWAFEIRALAGLEARSLKCKNSLVSAVVGLAALSLCIYVTTTAGGREWMIHWDEWELLLAGCIASLAVTQLTILARPVGWAVIAVGTLLYGILWVVGAIVSAVYRGARAVAAVARDGVFRLISSRGGRAAFGCFLGGTLAVLIVVFVGGANEELPITAAAFGLFGATAGTLLGAVSSRLE